jgi:hypothetical protein
MRPGNSRLVIQIHVFVVASVNDAVIFEPTVPWEVEQE